ncbi:aminotransferase class V-fold PLP-dependent enzyme [Pseudoalteromonas sp. T1lg65]|uniref:aminotransferase class V-fold PLP-dependent enzyme n=1 Tax=Pseudoalteromonas sp. T1lg65 TaxID=2077101 RepID=UPI003F79B7E1
MSKSIAADFCLPHGHYLLSHSVGRCLKTAQADFNQHFMVPWSESVKEPWQSWLPAIERFTGNLARLLNTEARLLCPQTNLSSALTKWVMSLPESNLRKVKVLMTEHDFPSMGFVFQQALDNIEVVYIPQSEAPSDVEVWKHYIDETIDWVFVSQVYSNTGHQAPVEHIAQHAKAMGCRVIVDVAQSLSVLPIDLQRWNVDCVIGSSVKWSCGGPGAGFLWVSAEVLPYCQVKDVGWFSHQNPFEFDIHHFAYHDSALRFWGGTPSVAPFVFAGHSLGYFAELGIEQVRSHNLALLSQLQTELKAYYVSPMSPSLCSGTAILDFAAQQTDILAALNAQNVSVDARSSGIRVSPHIYNTSADIDAFITVVKQVVEE